MDDLAKMTSTNTMNVKKHLPKDEIQESIMNSPQKRKSKRTPLKVADAVSHVAGSEFASDGKDKPENPHIRFQLQPSHQANTVVGQHLDEENGLATQPGVGNDSFSMQSIQEEGEINNG